jgi:hypothetical protein
MPVAENDFCKDRKQDDAEGAHIIQAFLSVEKTEEIQIRGRTARQGKRGSYSLILLKSDLVDLGIPAAAFERVAHDDLYDSLDRARTLVHDARLDAAQGALVKASKLDAISHAYLDALVEGRTDVAKAWLADIYDLAKTTKAVPVSCHILLDVSTSMRGQPCRRQGGHRPHCDQRPRRWPRRHVLAHGVLGRLR